MSSLPERARVKQLWAIEDSDGFRIRWRNAEIAGIAAGRSTLAHAFYHADLLGNLTALFSVNQLILAKYKYDPFGNLLSKIGPLAEDNLYRFASKEVHAMSGLVYFLYRYFDPSLQRWINRDPIAEWGGINLYAFVFNAVTECVDALGLSSIFYPGIPSSPGNPFDPSLPRPPSLTPPPSPTLPPTPPFQYDNSPSLQYPDSSEGNDDSGGSYCPWTPTPIPSPPSQAPTACSNESTAHH